MKIKWNFNELRKYNDEPLQLSGEVNLESALKERDKEIISASPIKVEGWLVVEDRHEYLVDLQLNTMLTLPSSRSLTAVEFEMTIPFSETYLAPGYTPDPDKYHEDEIVILLESEVLDLQKPIEDSVLAAIPTQIFTDEELESNEMPSGNDWEVVSEDTHYEGENNSKSDEQDSPFAALKDLFSENEADE